MTSDGSDRFLYPSDASSPGTTIRLSRRRLLESGVGAGVVASSGCLADDGTSGSTQDPTVFVFNTGEGTVSLIDPRDNSVVETRTLGLSTSFPSNQYTPTLTDDPSKSLWLNVGRGVRALTVGSLSETESIETGSGANWLEQTPDGRRVIVSAREPRHTQFLLDADEASESFGAVLSKIDRRPEGGRGDNEGPGPCDVTIHPSGDRAYVPDLFGDTLTVLSIDPFEIETQIDVDPVGSGPSAPWMGTVSPDGQTLLVEHNEGTRGTESVWDLSDPSAPEERVRLTPEEGLGGRPLTSEIGPDSEIGYVFTPGTTDVSVVDLQAGTVRERLDLGGEAFVGTWDPSRSRLYIPVQTADEVAVIDHEQRDIVDRISVGANPYGATAAEIRPGPESGDSKIFGMESLRVLNRPVETSYCIGNCACGHEL